MIIKDVRILKDMVNIVIQYDGVGEDGWVTPKSLIISVENVIKNFNAIQKLRELVDGDLLEILK